MTQEIGILRKVKCFLLDMDGTLYLDDELLPGAEAFIGYLRQGRIPHFFLTNNSSRSQEDYVMKLAGMGLEVPQASIFTSGEATARYLYKKKKQARIFLVGTPSLRAEFERHGFLITDEEPDFAVLGFDTTLTYQKLWDLCNFVREGIPYIATHPDINCPTSSGFMPDIGSMMALVETSTSRTPDVIIGKPYQPIVEAIVEKTGFQTDEIVMVGDRLYTDIALGQSGLTTVLLLSGETRQADVVGSKFQPNYIFKNVAALHAFLLQNRYLEEG